MKFDITQQPVFTTLITTLIISAVGMFALLHLEPSTFDLVESPSLLGHVVSDFQLSHPTFAACIAAVVIFLAALWLGRIIAVSNLYSLNTSIQLQTLTILMWSSAIGDKFLLSSLITALTAYALGSVLLSVRNIEHGNTFNAALALSLLLTLYTPSVVLWPFIPIILIIKGITLRELIIAVAGLLLPISGVLYIYWLVGADFVQTAQSLYQMLMSDSQLFEVNSIPLFSTIIFGLSLLLTLLSLLLITGNIHKTMARIKISVVTLIAAALTLLIPSASGLTAPLLAPGLGLFAAFGMALLRGYKANIVYLLFLLLLLASFFIPLDLPL